MNPILLAVIFVTAIGLLCAIMLVLAAKFMAVKVDERVTEVREVLPGANCGACGYPGCDGYAAALVEDGAEPTLCTLVAALSPSKSALFWGLKSARSRKKSRLSLAWVIAMSPRINWNTTVLKLVPPPT